MKKVITLVLVVGIAFSACPLAWADSGTPAWRATSSALIPGLGQILNDDHQTGTGKLKILTMWLIELGAIITTPILGSAEGFPIVMVGVGIFLANHAWSAIDAYQGASASQEVPTTGPTTR